MSREIPLTRGMIALVDDSDYEIISKHKWYAQASHSGIFYACRWEYRKAFPCDPKKRSIRMHNEIMGENPGLKVDHISRDGLDNRRMNLRWATHAQNMMNRKWRKPTKSGFRGVYDDHGTWRAMIAANGKRSVVGRAKSASEAAIIYDEAAKKLHGEFARLNFPENTVIQGGN